MISEHVVYHNMLLYTISVTEVSDVDVDFTEAVLMLIFYQQHSPIDYILVLIIVDHIDIAGLGIIIVDQLILLDLAIM